MWFDDSDAEARMVEFLDELASLSSSSTSTDHTTTTTTPSPPSPSPSSSSNLFFFITRPTIDRATASVLDLGCGNGSLLLALRSPSPSEPASTSAPWRGRLLGVDYSERSVQLARRVAEARGFTAGGEEEVEFMVWDVLGGELDVLRARAPSSNPTTTTTATTTPSDAGKREGGGSGGGGGGDGAGCCWDVVLDKGTFDAVSLSGERDARGRRVCEGYAARVLQLLRPGGVFLVTSCNWTEAELRGWFEAKTRGTETEEKGEEEATAAGTAAGARLRLAGRIEYPSFSFGGVKGQTISTLCFEKVLAE